MVLILHKTLLFWDKKVLHMQLHRVAAGGGRLEDWGLDWLGP